MKRDYIRMHANEARLHGFSSIIYSLWSDERFQLLRYAVAGVGVSLGYTLNVFLLVDVLRAFSPTVASALSFVVWTPVSYIVHRDFTFRAATGSRTIAIKFCATFVTRLLISSFVVYFFSNVVHVHYIFGVLANWVVLPILNYFILDAWVFRKVPDQVGTEIVAR